MPSSEHDEVKNLGQEAGTNVAANLLTNLLFFLGTVLFVRVFDVRSGTAAAVVVALSSAALLIALEWLGFRASRSAIILNVLANLIATCLILFIPGINSNVRALPTDVLSLGLIPLLVRTMLYFGQTLRLNSSRASSADPFLEVVADIGFNVLANLISTLSTVIFARAFDIRGGTPAAGFVMLVSLWIFWLLSSFGVSVSSKNLTLNVIANLVANYAVLFVPFVNMWVLTHHGIYLVMLLVAAVIIALAITFALNDEWGRILVPFVFTPILVFKFVTAGSSTPRAPFDYALAFTELVRVAFVFGVAILAEVLIVLIGLSFYGIAGKLLRSKKELAYTFIGLITVLIMIATMIYVFVRYIFWDPSVDFDFGAALGRIAHVVLIIIIAIPVEIAIALVGAFFYGIAERRAGQESLACAFIGDLFILIMVASPIYIFIKYIL